MRCLTARLLLAALVIFVAGCAGRDFVQPKPDAFVLGTTTYEEIVRQFGNPSRKETELREGHTVTHIHYGHALAPVGVGDVARARWIDFSFANGVLVGYTFYSTFQEDGTDFDETKVARITKGQTTRAQVEELLGRPGGFWIYPLIKSQSETAVMYQYLEIKSIVGVKKIYGKRLLIHLSSDGIVSDVEFESRGER